MSDDLEGLLDMSALGVVEQSFAGFVEIWRVLIEQSEYHLSVVADLGLGVLGERDCLWDQSVTDFALAQYFRGTVVPPPDETIVGRNRCVSCLFYC